MSLFPIIAPAAAVPGIQGSIEGFCFGGYTSGAIDRIESYSYTSDGNSTDLADLVTARDYVSGASDPLTNDRAYCLGGRAGGTRSDLVDRFAMTSTSNATDIGNLSVARNRMGATESLVSVYGVGGYTGFYSDVIDKTQFASEGDLTDVGDLSELCSYGGVGFPSTDTGYKCSGQTTPSTINSHSFASDGNGSDIGDRSINVQACDMTSSTSAVYCHGGGGVARLDVIDKFVEASKGTMTDVGNLTGELDNGSGSMSTTHGYSAGGDPPNNVINKYAHTSDGDATDVGDLTANMAIQPAGAGH